MIAGIYRRYAPKIQNPHELSPVFLVWFHIE